MKSRQHAQPDLSVYLIQVFSGCITLDSYDGISSSLLKNEPIHVNTTLTSQQVFKFTLAVLAALALAYIFLISAQILVVLVVAVLIASAVRPLVVKLRRLRLPEGLDATALLPQAVERNVAFVPGAAFYADQADARTLRLSFVTASAAQIDTGIAALAATIRAAQLA